MLSIWARKSHRNNPLLIADEDNPSDLLAGESEADQRDEEERKEIIEKQTVTIIHLQSVQEQLQKKITQQEETIKIQQSQLLQLQSCLCSFGCDIEDYYQQNYPNEAISLTTIQCFHEDSLLPSEELSEYLSTLMTAWIDLKNKFSLPSPTGQFVSNDSTQQLQTKVENERLLLLEQEKEELKKKLELLEQDYQHLLLQRQNGMKLSLPVQTAATSTTSTTSTSSSAIVATDNTTIPELEVHTELLSASMQSTLMVFSRELMELSQIYHVSSSRSSSSPFDAGIIPPLAMEIASTPTLTVISESLSKLLQLWPEIKRAILHEHQELLRKDQESREVVQQLIECKLRVAVANTELDTEKKRNKELQRENRLYRVAHARRNEKTTNANQSQSPRSHRSGSDDWFSLFS